MSLGLNKNNVLDGYFTSKITMRRMSAQHICTVVEIKTTKMQNEYL